jgi:hypothetical protein
MQLYEKFKEVLATRHLDPIVKEYKNQNVTIRKRVMNANSGIDLFILERRDYGLYPESFIR